MISAASVSALPFIGVFTSAGIIIWAAVGLAGLISGIVIVRVARSRNQPAKPAAHKTPPDAATQPPILTNAGPVSADNVMRAA